MNYLSLCQAVRSRIGLHGTGPSTVVSPTDVEMDIVDAVKDAWLDIQNSREEWDWMRTTESFETTVSKTNYTKTDLGGPSNRIARVIKDSFWLNDGTQWGKLTYIDEDTFELLSKNLTVTSVPTYFTVHRNDGSISVYPPDGVYSCEIDYWKVPQTLAANTDTPELPSQWHNLIVYLAIQKLSSSIASPSTQAEYAQAYATMWGQLARTQLKKKRMLNQRFA